MKTINKIALLVSLLGVVSVAEAATSTATMTINASNNSFCSVGFSNTAVTLALKKSGTQYILGDVTAGTSVLTSGVATMGSAPTSLVKGIALGNLEYSCSQGAVAAITVTTANNFKLVNLDNPSNYIQYGMFLGTPAGGPGWKFDNNISADVTDISQAVLAGKSVIQTGDSAVLDGTVATSQVSIATGSSSNAVAPGHYQDVVTATMLYYTSTS